MLMMHFQGLGVISLCKVENKNGSHLSQGPEGALSSMLGKLVQELRGGGEDDTSDNLSLCVCLRLPQEEQASVSEDSYFWELIRHTFYYFRVYLLSHRSW